MFSLAAALWAVAVVRARAHAHRLHALMAVLVAFKALTLLSQAGAPRAPGPAPPITCPGGAARCLGCRSRGLRVS